MNSLPEGQTTRSNATRQALMQAAEELIASKGIHSVSIRDIVKAAGQKNESALQYHFTNLPGLIEAIHQSRNTEVQLKRTELLNELLTDTKRPTLRQICQMMVLPAFLLAKSSDEFRNYILAFSHEIALAHNSAFMLVSKKGGGGESGQKTGELLRAALTHLDDATYRHRMDGVIRLVAISMGYYVRQKTAFRRSAADLFLNNLFDAMVGLLSAPISPETKAAQKQTKRTNK